MIVGNSGSPFQKVSALYCNYEFYGSIHNKYFILITYYLFFPSLNLFTAQKNLKQQSRGNICYTGCKHQTEKQFEGQDNC